MIFNEDGALEKSKYVTNFIVEKFVLSMETNSGNSSGINGNNEQRTMIINIIVRAVLIGSNQYEKCASVQKKHHLEYICNKNNALKGVRA